MNSEDESQRNLRYYPSGEKHSPLKNPSLLLDAVTHSEATEINTFVRLV